MDILIGFIFLLVVFLFGVYFGFAITKKQLYKKVGVNFESILEQLNIDNNRKSFSNRNCSDDNK